MKNFPKTNHSKNSSREDKMRKDTVCVCVCAFLSANIWEDRIRSRGKKKENEKKTDGWNQYVPDYKERVDVIERQQKSRKASRNDWLSDISNKKPRKYARKEARFISVDISIQIVYQMCRFKCRLHDKAYVYKLNSMISSSVIKNGILENYYIV